METQNLKGKKALIIGGTSGMGKATAQLLLSLGTSVTVASKSTESISNAVVELKASGNVSGKQVDITSSTEVEGFIAGLNDEGKIDYLVNASGIFGPKPFFESSIEEYEAMLNINRGFYFITQAAAKNMKASGEGAIVNIGSYWADDAIDAEVDLLQGDDGYSLRARLNISLPGLDRELAQALVNAGEQACPYSKAIRGNVGVTINLIWGLNLESEIIGKC